VGSPIGVEPQKLDVSLSPGENFTKTISICANETGYVNGTLNAIEPMKKWLKFSNKENVSVAADRTYYVNVEFKILENANPGEYKGRIEITHNQFLFSWDDVPGNDSKRLRRSLKDVYKIDWAENAKISKSHDNKTITINKRKVFFCTIGEANITIAEENDKATLKINDGNVYTLIVKKDKKEKDKRNIYRSVKEKIPIILTIKTREINLKNVSTLLLPQKQGKGYA
jgi:hypothetical protein